ncbi:MULTISPECIES: DASS family sodium-coupled anion symporter [unclassified Bradyrhizobium]|uniref:DASS family sodium-coupled anion symporter n=1 Tax=unclassified Bradyrhizobium TaxID=2631580 RepID=UPI001BA61878|nr:MULTISPECIES: DASS family sodium-coupled anion symporter [unclassified Bradyrhizobium]MBR1206483.1 DASS family sodium-coupled anion symporter [Bradyrhizobium sp. AUGA SZCCT0124]MBR1315539.1 DASS family sodium-coupled anion symporter [Bradyrhizobium sp. AUGA SZCCT0051]MBR1338399.1 DASS family sodium-coupled anion symporter [Bradyrhizobium sp. AUGA SZCCT0105]MBR1356054.1 DASS family sodium-coupled anion symporter [Bradyrhizobium sp. AUGA SZCCT0045]
MKSSWRTFAPLLVWLVIYLVPVPSGLNANQWHYFAVFAAVITGLILESMPVGAVGLIGLTVAGVGGYVEPDPNKSLRWMLAGFSESTVWLIVGAFVFSIGYRKSGLGRRLALLLVRGLGRRTIGLGYAVAFSDLVLAPATPSNTARSGGTIYPIVSNIPRIYGSEPGPTAGKIGTFVMWTAFATTAVTSSLFLTALAPNAAALSIAKKLVNIEVGWSQWFIGFAPLGILLLLLVPLLSYVICRPEIKESPEIVIWSEGELAKMGPPSRHEWIMAVLVLLAMFLWICGSNPNISVPLLGSNFINATTVVFVVISLMLLTGVIAFEDIVAEKSAWEVFFYFTSLLTLSSGLNEIGFIKWVAEGYAKPLAGTSPLVGMILLVTFFFWIHYFFSSITSHTAAVLPVVLAVGSSIPGLSVQTLMLLCVYSLGLMGVISPYATGPAPMYYGSGYIGKGDFWKFGLIFGVIYFAGLLLIVLPWLQMIG